MTREVNIQSQAAPGRGRDAGREAGRALMAILI